MKINIAGYGDASVTPTADPRITIFDGGRKNWRTVARDDIGEWAITGAPYATKTEALANVPAVQRDYFGA